jgi:hypothetical protein
LIDKSRFGLWLSRKRLGVQDLQADATNVTLIEAKLPHMEDRPTEIQELTKAILILSSVLNNSDSYMGGEKNK